MKSLNINRQYDKLEEYSYVVWISRHKFYEEDFYWFDKEKYKFIHNEKLVKNGDVDTERYVRFIWFDPSFHTKDFYFNNIYNDELKQEMLKIMDDDERVTCFMADVAGDNDFTNEFMDYVDYLVLTEMVVNWCKENGINYTFKQKKPSKKYLSAPQLKPDYKWHIPKKYLASNIEIFEEYMLEIDDENS